MNPASEPADAWTMTRREAIRRTALVLGAAISPSILAGALNAQTARIGTASKPAYLTTKEFETAAAMAERIIPRTETAGALDVGVPVFIDLMYGAYMTDEEKRVFAAGLAEVQGKSESLHQRSFSQLTPAQQDGLLKGLAADSQDKEKSFFHQIREMTILGYFSSEPVGKTVLHYDPIPGRFVACVPISAVGNVSWTR